MSNVIWRYPITPDGTLDAARRALVVDFGAADGSAKQDVDGMRVSNLPFARVVAGARCPAPASRRRRRCACARARAARPAPAHRHTLPHPHRTPSANTARRGGAAVCYPQRRRRFRCSRGPSSHQQDTENDQAALCKPHKPRIRRRRREDAICGRPLRQHAARAGGRVHRGGPCGHPRPALEQPAEGPAQGGLRSGCRCRMCCTFCSCNVRTLQTPDARPTSSLTGTFWFVKKPPAVSYFFGSTTGVWKHNRGFTRAPSAPRGRGPRY